MIRRIGGNYVDRFLQDPSSGSWEKRPSRTAQPEMDYSGDDPVELDAIPVGVNISLRWKSFAAAAADYCASSIHIPGSMLAVHPDLSLQCGLSHFAIAEP